jgi:Arylsulfotransferase (ASST)
MLDRVALLLFVLGVAFLSYLYGVASSRFSLFPYEIVRDAWVAGKALREAIAAEFDEMPPGALALETGSSSAQAAERMADAERPGEGLILMTGGPYVLMSECPELGCLAWITDRSGTVHHAWPIDRDAPWGDMRRHRGFTDVDNIYPVGLHLYDNGDLLVSYSAQNAFPYSVGLAKFDKNAKLLWQKESLSHHWLYVDRQGLIYAPAHELIESPLPIPGTAETLVCEERKIYEDVILVLDADGEPVRKISVLRSLFESGYGGLVYLTPSPCDPLHLNDVRVLNEPDASEYPSLLAGDMLISIRELNTIAVMDRATTRIKWAASGLTLRQHAPRFLGGNSILAFDNLGGPADKGGSRLAKIDLASHAVATLFPAANTPSELNFFSEFVGHIDLNAGRSHALVSLTMQGRVVEIDLQTGQVLWEYDNVHDVTPYMKTSGQGTDQRYARFGITGAYYVQTIGFLSDALERAAAR